MRSLVPLLVLSTGCGAGVCGTADVTLLYGGGEAVRWDEDGDGTADLVERCGPLNGAYGLRRSDLGITTMILTADIPGNDFSESLEVGTYLLPAASLAFRTVHLEEGATLDMGQVAGGGLHKLGGTAEEIYATYGLLDAELTVLAGPKRSKGTVARMNNAEQWRIAWRVDFGDPQNGMVMQSWDAEDWVEVSDGTEVGDPIDVPPDMPTSR